MTQQKQLKLGASILAPRAANGGWRHPAAGSYIDAPLAYFTEVIQTAERGKLDFMFLPDYYSVFAKTAEEFSKNINVWLEPVSLLSAMIAVTKKIGVAVTLSTTYYEPYHVARMIASMDQLSGGRACWNIVTSRGDTESRNFSPLPRPSITERDAHATTFIELVKALWQSWSPDAIVQNRLTGQFADADKINVVQHQSEWFSMNAPLNVAPSPQGMPICMQAGQSETFRERAVQTSDVIFTQLNDIEQAKEFYRDVKRRAVQHDIAPEHILVMPGLQVIVAETYELAEQKQRDLEQFDDASARTDLIALYIGLDVTSLSIDMPLPAESNMGERKKYADALALARKHKLTTIRALYQFIARQNSHLTLVGTPSYIADEMARWLHEEAVDGFVFLPHILPSGMQDFVDYVIPALQERGVFRTDYEGETLREHLGLRLSSSNIL